MVQISDENCKPFWSMLSRRVRKIPFSSSQFSIHDDSLLQNVTDIISKCDSYFITKCDRSLFQPFMTKSFSVLNLLCYKMQNATKCTVITKCGVYYRLRKYTRLLIYLNSLINVLQDWL